MNGTGHAVELCPLLTLKKIGLGISSFDETVWSIFFRV